MTSLRMKLPKKKNLNECFYCKSFPIVIICRPNIVYIECSKCGLQTKISKSEDIAIKKWNKGEMKFYEHHYFLL